MTMQENFQNLTDSIHDSLDIDLESDSGSIGKTLARARIIQNLEQREVAAHLNVDLSVIQAIERDDFRTLGAPVFVRNYLKRYAQLTRISEDEILERYKQLGHDELPPLKVTRSIKPQTKTSDIRWLSYPLIVALVGWLGWLGLEKFSVHFDSSDNAGLAGVNTGNNSWLSLPKQEREQKQEQEQEQGQGQGQKPEPEPEFVVENTDSEVSRLAGSRPTTPPIASSSAISPAVAQSENNNVAAAKTGGTRNWEATTSNRDPDQETTSLVAIATEVDPEPAGDGNDSDEFANAIDGESRLVLEFSDDCWLEIKDANGKRLAYGVIKAGSVSNLAGPAPFSVTLGNAGAATITLNGKAVDKSVYMPKRGSVSRFTLEDPQGG